MGLFDKIKTSTGLNYLDTEPTTKKSPSPKEDRRPLNKEDRDVRAMEIKIQNVIEQLQEIQAKLRVRRGI